MRATIYATRAEAEKAITAIDAARAPDGTEERVRYVRGREVSRERVPAKPWAEPIELDDGRFAVPVSPRKLAAIEGREVMVRGERLRVPRAQDVSEIEIAADERGEPIVREDGSVVLRERVRTEEPVDEPTRTR